MKKFATLAIAAGLATLVTTGIAVAGPGGGECGGPEHHVMKLVRDLDLTEDQRAALKSIREANREERDASHGDREAALETLKAQLLSDTPDTAVLHSLVDKRLDGMGPRLHQRMDTLIDIQAILTPEQRQQVADALEDAPRGRHGRRGHRGPE